MNEYNMLRCPLCRSELEKIGGSLMCLGEKKRHCYDLASSGYVNLLPPGKEKNARTGDEKNMISARCRFLETGAYSKISQKVGEIIADSANTLGKKEISLVDAGCGEGYHTCNILRTLSEHGLCALALGFDASKHGAAAGAKRAKKLEDGVKAFFAAGNIFELPLKEESIDFAVSMFAPIAGEETYRFLKPNGRYIVVSAGERHLYELRCVLYDDPRPSSGNVKIPDGFETENEEYLTYTFSVNSCKTLKDLFVMTPFYYKTSLSDKAKLESVERLDITADIKYTVLKKI